jgi:hypothetical protein
VYVGGFLVSRTGEQRADRTVTELRSSTRVVHGSRMLDEASEILQYCAGRLWLRESQTRLTMRLRAVQTARLPGDRVRARIECLYISIVILLEISYLSLSVVRNKRLSINAFHKHFSYNLSINSSYTPQHALPPPRPPRPCRLSPRDLRHRAGPQLHCQRQQAGTLPTLTLLLASLLIHRSWSP